MIKLSIVISITRYSHNAISTTHRFVISTVAATLRNGEISGLHLTLLFCFFFPLSIFHFQFYRYFDLCFICRRQISHYAAIFHGALAPFHAVQLYFIKKHNVLFSVPGCFIGTIATAFCFSAAVFHRKTPAFFWVPGCFIRTITNTIISTNTPTCHFDRSSIVAKRRNFCFSI